MHPSGEVGRFQMDNLSSPPGDWCRSPLNRSMKTTRNHPDDVLIGNDEWIRFVDVAGRTETATNLDALIAPIESFWRSLEVNCVSECCGINAHSFLQKDIWNAVRSCHDAALKQKLTKLRRRMDGLTGDCVFSNILNQYFDKTMFSELLDHVIATVNRM